MAARDPEAAVFAGLIRLGNALELPAPSRYLCAHPFHRAKELLRLYREIMASMP
jgi:hypothetical protein